MPYKYAHLSDPAPAWLSVAEKHAPLDTLSSEVYRLPLVEFRKVPYKASPLPSNAPQTDKDLCIRTNTVTVRDGTSISLRIYEPLEKKEGRLLFFNVHGGGWMVGTPETEEAQNRFIAMRNDAVVVAVDYRLAPEQPFPHAIHDSLDALLWCVEHVSDLGIDPSKIVLGGGSAGANIVAALTLLLRDDLSLLNNNATVIGQVLNIPVTCHPNHFPTDKYELHSYEQNKNTPLVDAARMHLYWNNYISAADAGNPLTSPLLAATHTNLPPALVQVAGLDPLRDEGLAYAEALKNSGVATDLRVYPGLPHAFYVYPDLEPSQQYFDAVTEWIAGLKKD
ncbi:hypothetical protein SEUCBS139899_008137 [Sporothrix eucalyptigena]|uniref:Alpha/beta hydrolase fold-3 domain-containing protein n=1 Tax=Sporothrix eucalyptigena TaxID=1812306 RepID=A0ABP0D219_9PEZI